MFACYGIAVGILLGFFGMGGFLVTPALLVSGYPTRVAVGSALAVVFGTTLIATLRHRNFEQVNRRVGVALFLGSTAGIELGRRAVGVLDAAGLATDVVSGAYVALLLAVGVVVYRDPGSDGVAASQWITSRIRAVTVPPRATVGGTSISVWVIVAVGLLVGVLAGMLGVGGGFLLVPSLVYGLGLPVPVAVGTNVFQMAVSTAYGTATYASDGFVALPAVVALLVGSTLGARIGSAATNYVDEDDVTDAFAAVLCAGGLAVASDHLSSSLGVPALETLGRVLLFGSATVVSGVVVVRFLAALRRNEADDRSTA